MDNARYIETIAFMGWNTELTREGFLRFLENNKEIRLINKPERGGSFRAVGEDGTRYFTINPIDRDIMREIGGRRIDQLILCDDERKMIYGKHGQIICKILSSLTEQIPEEYKILFYEY